MKVVRDRRGMFRKKSEQISLLNLLKVEGSNPTVLTVLFIISALGTATFWSFVVL